MTEYLMAIVVAVLFCWPFVSAYRQKTKMCQMNIDWYLQKVFAETGSRSLICLRCGSTRINPERVLGGMYMRRHYCARCGATLYYSVEQ